MQNNYWNMMTDKRFALYYLDAHFERCTKIDRGLSIFLAIASSSAIAGWAIWQQLGFILAIVIAASQVITVINSYLPYKKRKKEIYELKAKLTPIYFDMEYQWNNVAEGILSQKEINDLYYSLVRKWVKVENEFFIDDVLPMNKNLIKKAEELKNRYINNTFFRR